MGRENSGRRPKPSAVKIAQGNPGHRPINKNEPRPSGIPTCPDHLDGPATTEWNRISQELIALGLLTSIDRAALAAYCVVYSRWVDAELNIQKYGIVIKNPNSGLPFRNPYVSIADVAIEQMRKFMTEFGCTPSSRSRLNVNAQEQADPFAAFMAGIGATDDLVADVKGIDD